MSSVDQIEARLHELTGDLAKAIAHQERAKTPAEKVSIAQQVLQLENEIDRGVDLLMKARRAEAA